MRQCSAFFLNLTNFNDFIMRLILFFTLLFLGNNSQSNSQLTNISVYPNPSRGEFNISFDLERRQDVNLSITNYLGKVVFTEELKDQEGQYNKTIDLGNKANGIYMLNITTNNQNINHKIIIQ